MPPHSVVLSVIGAALLWVGWFGFNAGSALKANDLASNAFLVTHLAGAAAALAWMAIEWIKTGKPTVLGAISGAVAGLAMITPAAGFTTPMYALVIGVVAGLACFFGATIMKQMMGYDDTLDAFGVHGVSGTIGTLLVGVFAVGAVNAGKAGLVDGNPRQIVNQLLATVAAWVLAVVGSVVLLAVTGAMCGLRVSREEEYDGLDLSQHGESGYNLEEDTFAGAYSAEPPSAAKLVAREESVVAAVPASAQT
jgi:Amt family ammonium transporter